MSIGGEADVAGSGTATVVAFNEFNDMLDETFANSILLPASEYFRFWGYLESDPTLVTEFLSRLIDKLVRAEKVVRRGNAPGKEFLDVAEVAAQLHGNPAKLRAALSDYHTALLSTVYYVALNYDFVINTDKADDKLRAAMVRWHHRIERNPMVSEFFKEAFDLVEQKGQATDGHSFSLTDLLESVANNDSVRGIARPLLLPAMLRGHVFGPAGAWPCVMNRLFMSATSPGALSDYTTNLRRGLDGLIDMLKVHNTEARLLCVLQMLDEILHTAAALPTDQMEKLTRCLDNFYCWPVPFGPLVQRMIALAERELACPGAGLRQRWLEEHPAADRLWTDAARRSGWTQPVLSQPPSKHGSGPVPPPPPPPPPPEAAQAAATQYQLPIYIDPRTANAPYLQMLAHPPPSAGTTEDAVPTGSLAKIVDAEVGGDAVREVAQLVVHVLYALAGSRLRLPVNAVERLVREPEREIAEVYQQVRQLEWTARTLGPVEVRLQRTAASPGDGSRHVVLAAAEAEEAALLRQHKLVEIAVRLFGPDVVQEANGAAGTGAGLTPTDRGGAQGGASFWVYGDQRFAQPAALPTLRPLPEAESQPVFQFFSPSDGGNRDARIGPYANGRSEAPPRWPTTVVAGAAASLLHMVVRGSGRRIEGDPAGWAVPPPGVGFMLGPPRARWQLRLGVAGGAAALHTIANAAALLDRLFLRPHTSADPRVDAVAAEVAVLSDLMSATIREIDELLDAWAATRLLIYLLPTAAGEEARRPRPAAAVPDAAGSVSGAGATRAGAVVVDLDGKPIVADSAADNHLALHTGYGSHGLAQFVSRTDFWFARHVYSSLGGALPVAPHLRPPPHAAGNVTGGGTETSHDAAAEHGWPPRCPALATRGLVLDYFRHATNRFEVQLYQLHCWIKPADAGQARADHSIVFHDRLQLGPAALADWLAGPAQVYTDQAPVGSALAPTLRQRVEAEIAGANAGQPLPIRVAYTPVGLDGGPLCDPLGWRARGEPVPLAPPPASGAPADSAPPPTVPVVLERVDCRNIPHAGQEALGASPDPSARWVELRLEFGTTPTARQHRHLPAPHVASEQVVSATFELASEHPQAAAAASRHVDGFHILVDGICYGPYCKVVLSPLGAQAAKSAQPTVAFPAGGRASGDVDDGEFGAMGGRLRVMTYLPLTL
jgi:hypothetical protein